MSKKKSTSTAALTTEQAPEQVPASPVKKYKWAGPFHAKGIHLFDVNQTIRPLTWTDEQIEDFLEKYPHRSGWWKVND